MAKTDAEVKDRKERKKDDKKKRKHSEVDDEVAAAVVKKDKKDKKRKSIDGAGDVSIADVSVAEVDTTMADGAPLLVALVPFANPLCDDKAQKKVLKSVKKGKTRLDRGLTLSRTMYEC